MSRPSAKAKQVAIADAPVIVPGVTRVERNRASAVVREVVYRSAMAAAVYLSYDFEVEEIGYFVTEPTKRTPAGKAEWRTLARKGAPRLAVKAP